MKNAELKQDKRLAVMALDRAADCRPCPAPGSQALAGRTIRRGWFLPLSLLIACTNPERGDGAGNLFTAGTSEGTIMVRVEGFTKGFTNTELTRLIRDGLAKTYPIQRDVPPDIASNVPRMVWHVNNDERNATAVVTVRIIQNGRVVRSDFAKTPAPNACPPAVFMHEVSELARNVIPPAANGRITLDQKSQGAANLPPIKPDVYNRAHSVSN
jgi:hypothetical protein